MSIPSSKSLLNPLTILAAILSSALMASEAMAACGGFNQRACCLLERVPSCDPGLRETGAIWGFQCAGFPAGTCGFSTPDSLENCGGDNQRACCVGETEGFDPCDTGNIEVLDVYGGTCPSPAWFVGASAGTCWTPTPCGHEGQRACTIGDGLIDGKSCAAKLIEIGADRSADPLLFGPSSGWCTRPAPCGGNGQRACCNGIGEFSNDGDACNSDLTKVAGVAGDSSCGIGNLVGNPVTAAHSCIDPGIPQDGYPEPTTGWLGASEVEACDAISGKGYADLHVHMFGHLAHGGRVLAGKPYDEQGGGIYEALNPVDDLDLHGVHGLAGDALGFGTNDLKGSHVSALIGSSTFGAPTFNAWPTWSTTSHQQMYYTWLERAWRGGLRLMVQFAVTNEALCIASGADDLGVDCSDEMAPVDEQIDATYSLQDFIDGQNGGPGSGWFRIVRTPVEAQQVIDAGKLAVVLGIEVANLFDCKKDGCPEGEVAETDEFGDPLIDEVTGETIMRAQTPQEYVEQQVDEYYDAGVRVIFPVHNFDNAFGAPATWQDAIHAGNRASEGSWWSLEDCSAEGYGFDLGLTSWLLSALSFLNFDAPIIPAVAAHCNQGGLTDLGISTIGYMMDKGILVDIDHMSNHAVDTTLDIAEERGAPVIASHVQFFDLNRLANRHERMRTRAQLERIAALGGMIAAMLKDDQQEGNYGSDDARPVAYSSLNGNVIANDCRHSSKTWAQMYQYSVDVMDGPVAMGSDFNGVAGHVGPRFGFDACGQNHVERAKQGLANNRLGYPFELAGFGRFEAQVTGTRTFDFNNDGLAHVGLLPDLVADLRGIGLSNAELAPLFNSAIGFVNVWKRGEGEDVPLPSSDVSLGCQDIVVSADGFCESGLDATVADASTAGLGFLQSPPAPYSLGTTAVVLEAEGLDHCDNPVSSCSGIVTVVDDTPPDLSCPGNIVAECNPSEVPAPARPVDWPAELPWPYGEGDLRGTSVLFEPREIVTDNCSGAEFAGCSVPPGHPFDYGSTQVSCSGFDAAGNQGSCDFAVTIQDTTPPSIECPVAVTAECTGSRSAAVTPLRAEASDICAGYDLTSHPTASFPMGTTPLVYEATDEVGLSASCTSQIIVEDTTPPVIDVVAASPRILWPPNHEMVDVVVSVSVTDRCDDVESICRVTGIASNEDENATGDGNTAQDWYWNPAETGASLGVVLRAEREGSGDGRTYTIEVTCADETGNATVAMTTVAAPKNDN